MNALQQLIQDFLDEHPGESYASIARRGGMGSWQTVQALRNRANPRQTPRPDTLEGLARGLGVPIDVVRQAAAESAGYGTSSITDIQDDRLRLIVSQVGVLDDERFEVLARRLRMLVAEQHEEEEARRKRRRNGGG